MDQEISIKIKAYLERFKEVLKTSEDWDEQLISDRNVANIPYSYKHILLFLFERLEKEDPQYMALKSEFDQIIKKINDLEKKHEKVYSERLVQEVKESIDFFPKIFNYFSDIEEWTQEADHSLHIRDSLEFQLIELRQKREIADTDRKVSYLDLGFKCLYSKEIEKIIILDLGFERSYYPDSFWWRHPSKILAEKQVKMKQ